MTEIWDAYDRQCNKIENTKLIRGEIIPAGMYHLVGETIVKHKDGTFLLMQRDWTKHLGGTWELTAGGSALEGETSLACAMRELKEETGIVACDLTEVRRIVHDEHHSIYVIYLCLTDWNKKAIVLQAGETIAYQWVDRETLCNMELDQLASSRAVAIVKETDNLP